MKTPMRKCVPVPAGESEESLRAYLASFRQPGWDDRMAAEMGNYLSTDLRRFLFTLDLVPDRTGRLLEIGADPYFTTLLLRQFRRYSLSLTNGHGAPGRNAALLRARSGEEVALEYTRFNLEEDELPRGEAPYDVVLCCEVIEHMTRDPLHGLAAINRGLVPGGTLILTTPNAARLDNALAALAGVTFHDQFSAYGPYGRHNREYVPAEMLDLLARAGFRVETAFLADVHPRTVSGARRILRAPARAAVAALRGILATAGVIPRPPSGLGYYMFFRATKVQEPRPGRPSWLYRSYAPTEG